MKFKQIIFKTYIVMYFIILPVVFGFTSATTAGKTDNVVEKLINNDSRYTHDFLKISK